MTLVHLICGYRQTGKDTLHKNLKDGHVYLHNSGYSHPWSLQSLPWWLHYIVIFIYVFLRILFEEILTPNFGPPPESPYYIIFGFRETPTHVFTYRNRGRVAEAGPVKEYVYFKQLQLDPNIEWDTHKTSLVEHPITKERKPLRQFLIDYAEGERKKDPHVWARLANTQIESLFDTHKNLQVVDVTDFRKPNEADVISRPKVTTRLFRSSVIAGRNEKSEHDLRTLRTTFLLVPRWIDFLWALLYFPQYHVYGPIGVLTYSKMN